MKHCFFITLAMTILVADVHRYFCCIFTISKYEHLSPFFLSFFCFLFLSYIFFFFVVHRNDSKKAFFINHVKSIIKKRYEKNEKTFFMRVFLLLFLNINIIIQSFVYYMMVRYNFCCKTLVLLYKKWGFQRSKTPTKTWEEHTLLRTTYHVENPM